MRSAYFLIVLFCIVQRLSEVSISKSNCMVLESRGFCRFESKTDFLTMIVLHVLWFVGLIVEPLLWPALVPAWLFFGSLTAFLAAQLLRVWTILSLKEHWNITVLGPLNGDSGELSSFITSGPYQYLRHPNYLAIVVEFLALPLMGGAWRTALIFSYLNLPILARRISTEERALRQRKGYEAYRAKRGALLPCGFSG